ncbi:MAG TPA: ATP-binding protein [Humidesulfovibrio sp.]|uniref:sensor histidine kinase n=1 Tax=Humidesulfovibrio sp. TaxID=2910988 RepID=UPI002CFDEF5E|nr:ATP-binding protein [Humidesulfovibrio sp.]HWR02993.1 ATP-binding protein [Humidesulfovibrio sp.]
MSIYSSLLGTHKPLQFVKVLTWTFLILILGTNLMLSVFLSKHAERVLLEKQKEFGLLLAENVSHQIFTRFTLPTIIGYGQISLRVPDQFARLDQVVRTTIHSFHVQEVRIYDPELRVTYSTDPNLVLRTGLAGEGVKRALTHDEPSFELFSKISGFSALFKIEMRPGSVVMRGFTPLRMERNFGPGAKNPIMGILEFSQDITDDYMAVVNFERLVYSSSLITSMVLFSLIISILRRVDRISAERQAEKEKLMAELHQQEKLAGMGRMVAGVAHEIRNPLGIIQSSAELVLKKAKADNHPHTRIIEAIYDESRRLSRTVNDFLDYARPRQPRQDEVDLCRILEQACVFLERECEDRGIRLVRACPEGTSVRGDRDLIYRAVYNVLGNAMQAMPQGGTIQVDVRAQQDGDAAEAESGPRLTLAVRDSGPGFDLKNLDKLKDPFFSTKDTGTGLGLAIVTSIVESHGGAVTLKNHPEGGAVVELTLPLARTIGGESKPDPAPDPTQTA